MKDTTSISRSDSIVVQLRNRIMQGEFEPGFHLQEIPLAQEMGVSRTPVHEALIVLAKEGLLEPGPKRGYKLRTFSMQEVLEAYDVRATLEGMVCRIIAEQGASAQSLETLERCIWIGKEMLAEGQFSEAEHDPWLEMNHTFHSTLVAEANNRMLTKFLNDAQRVPMASARQVAWYKLDDRNVHEARGAQTFHEHIFDAIKRRQGTRAESQMREHIFTARELLRVYLDELGASEGTPIPFSPSVPSSLQL